MMTFYHHKLWLSIFQVIGLFHDEVIHYDTSSSMGGNQFANQRMHLLEFLSLTNPGNGSLLLKYVSFYLHFYILSQCKN